MPKKRSSIDDVQRFIDFSGGINLSDDSVDIRNNQVQKGLNAFLRNNGIMRRPGSTALASFDPAGVGYGLHNYKQYDGTEILLCVVGQKLYRINKSTGEDTELFDLGGTGEAFFTDYLDKCWVANGNTVVKVENTTAYQVGITAPTGVTAAKLAGGTLPDGVYNIRVCYARKVSGTNVLYSQGQTIGAVTLSGGDNSIRFSNFANSADGQVNNKVAFLTDAGGSTYYFYHETDDNTTTTFDITSNANRNSDLQYGVLAVNNAVPGAFEFIFAFDGRIWGVIDNVLHYSLKNTSNVYDLERFFPLNRNYYPYKINGLFSVAESLYLSTPDGMIEQPGGVVAAAFNHREKQWNFPRKNMNTVKPYNKNIIGLTNDGVKVFDGDRFFDYDISQDIDPEVTKMYNTTANFNPTAVIFRRNLTRALSTTSRTEYHLCYNDDSLTTVSNNRRVILNLDRLNFLPNKEVIAPWEMHTNGATHLVVDSNNTIFSLQSHASAPKLYKEDANNTIDNGIYLEDGTVGDSSSNIRIQVWTKTVLHMLSDLIDPHTLRVLMLTNKSVLFKTVVRDITDTSDQREPGGGEGATQWDVFEWDVGEWSGSEPNVYKEHYKQDLSGFMIYLIIDQTANDPDFNIMRVEITQDITRNEMT